MPKIDVYTQPYCGFCTSALRLLTQKGAAFNEISVAGAPKVKEEMIKRAQGGRTTPQIFIGDVHVGGCDDLFALERAGKLDTLLNG